MTLEGRFLKKIRQALEVSGQKISLNTNVTQNNIDIITILIILFIGIRRRYNRGGPSLVSG